MTARAPNWFEQKYVKGVIHALQSEGFLLRSCVNETGTIKGNQATWKLAGAGEATETSSAIQDSPVMNADRTTISATMKDYEANEWIKTTDLEKMPENEQQVAQKTGAWALGRKFDKILIGAMDTAASAIATVGDGSAAISILDPMTAQGAIADLAVGSHEYFCALPQKLLQQMEIYREFASSDYVGDDLPLLKQVGARRWRGITFVPVPSAYLNVPASNQIDGYLWVKEALGWATNYDLRSRIDYVPTKKAYFAANDMGGCAAVLLPDAIKRLRFATNVALSRPSP